ncbi:hypothetical protein N9V91_02350 [Acidimicrobiaceae bacterium]|nr:hypothetical protein [Acidimicrobiaceae bacterium]
MGRAVSVSLEAIDAALDDDIAALPSPGLRRAIDGQLAKRASVRVASLFFLAYSMCDSDWDLEHIPTGLRGKYGDKLLAAGLSGRTITLHDNITAFGENLGWKGNVQEFRLSTDSRFSEFIGVLTSASEEDRWRGLGYISGRFAESQRLQEPLPPLPSDLLTFAKARALFWEIVGIPSEGHIQQFTVAGLLRTHRRRHGHVVKTHHPHAADTFDGTAGDVEEFRDGLLVAAYEVTVRDDWKNRLPDLRRKMSSHKLTKYWIIASQVYNDNDLADAQAMLGFLDGTEADLAIVDLHAFVDVFLAELTAIEIRQVVNEIYADLLNPKLSNREDFIRAFASVVGDWLDTLS